MDERLLNTLDGSHDISVYHDVPMECDQIGSVLTSVSPTLDTRSFYHQLKVRAEISAMMASIGACVASDTTILFIIPQNDDEMTGKSKNGLSEEELYDCVFEEITSGLLKLNDVFVSAAHAKPPLGSVSAQHLSKVWRIDLETAERTLQVTMQRT